MSTKLLIVEDEVHARKSLKALLASDNYQVHSAPTGEKALEALGDETYHLILLDLKLPGINGVDVMRQAIQLQPDIKVIILTGHGSLETAIQALRLGAADYILKPLDADAILASVGEALFGQERDHKKELLIQQMETSLQGYKDIEGLTVPERPSRQTLSLPAGITVDLERRELWRGGDRVYLTPTEGKLFRVFLENKGRVLSHEEIVFMVQGYTISEDDAPEVLRPLISRLRSKLNHFSEADKWIQNVRGTGYIYDPPLTHMS